MRHYFIIMTGIGVCVVQIWPKLNQSHLCTMDIFFFKNDANKVPFALLLFQQVTANRRTEGRTYTHARTQLDKAVSEQLVFCFEWYNILFSANNNYISKYVLLLLNNSLTSQYFHYLIQKCSTLLTGKGQTNPPKATLCGFFLYCFKFIFYSFLI